eukprot:2289342-Amphidinium_carterae.1
MNAIALKRQWDSWLKQVAHGFNLWSTPAANTFRAHLEDAQTRHELWTKMPTAEKLQFEQKYTYGLGQLPP